MLEAAKRQPKKIQNKKDPMSADLILKFFTHFKDSQRLTDIRDLAFISLSFAGFFRFAEVSAISGKDVKIKEDYIEIYLECSKTDQYRDGNMVIISKGKTIACPVNAIKKYILAANINLNSLDYIFRPLTKFNKCKLMINTNKKISYSTIRTRILAMVKCIPEGKN